MKHCFLFALALLLTVPAAFAQHPRIAEIKADAIRLAENHQVASPVLNRSGETLALDRFYGHFSLIDQNAATNGFGYADVNDPSYTFVKLFDYPVPTNENLPLGGSFASDGRFYMVTTVGGIWGFYVLDLDNPTAGYEEINFPFSDELLFGTDETPVGLQYDPETGTMVLATLFCDLDDEGAYRQTILYTIDLATGGATHLRDVNDPNADGTVGNTGFCPISFSWDGGDEFFGVDIVEDDLFYVNLDTGDSQRFSDPFIFNVNYVQHSAYNYNDGVHYLMPFSLETDSGPYFGNVYACTPDDGCTLGGFINNNEPPVEQITASFLWAELVSSEEGASAQGVRMEVYPNPMASRSTVTLALDAPQTVTVAVYDLLGRRVATLHDGVATQLELSFDGQSLPSGVYFVSARGERFATTQKVVVAR